MSEWRDIHESRPLKAGQYLVCCPNPTCRDPCIEVADWYESGDTIYLDIPPGGGMASLLDQIMGNRYVYTVPHAGFWTQGDGAAWEFGAITHWMELPELPDGYKEDE